MQQKTDQMHIGDHFCLSLTMQGHLQTAGATTGGTVSVYLVNVYNEQKRKKNTAHRSPTLTLVYNIKKYIQVFDWLKILKILKNIKDLFGLFVN